MRNTSKGFGLVEIMVALVIGLVVSLGIVQIFSASRATYQSQNSAARMQEDARFILSKLVQEIRMTGMNGCLKLDSSAPVAPAISRPLAMENQILWDNANRRLTLVTADIGITGSSPTWTIISDCITSTQLYVGARAPAAGQTAFPLRQLVYTLNGTDLNIQATTAGKTEPLLQNVVGFDVLFGMVGNPMSYTQTITPANAVDIRSVLIRLTLSDPSGRVQNQQYSVVAYLRNRF
ncbi:pilus assembly protein PilW [Pseudomonas syringae]|uniref:Pilus assembly protein PilW n=1 Tax=Pseudomonas syringae TaxID=317 RepID=A0A244ELF6_PSESX|nr:prepilin-type N-terminal cleavage/methylation domain-containing protein [Pseudomonas syringae]OUM05365.1 pilus assembly protein PilW [Pseudomonas syringae]